MIVKISISWWMIGRVRSALSIRCFRFPFFTLITSIVVASAIVLIVIIAVRRSRRRSRAAVVIVNNCTRSDSVAHVIHEPGASIATVMMIVVGIMGRWHGRIKVTRVSWRAGDVIIHPIILTWWVVIVGFVRIVIWRKFCGGGRRTRYLWIVSD